MADIQFKVGRLDNIHDPIKLGIIDQQMPEMAFLEQAVNVDIDDLGVASRRKGLSAYLTATNPHSLFYSKVDQKTYFVTGGALKTTLGATVATLTVDLPVSYIQVNDDIVLSNGVDIGWLKEGVYVPFSQTPGPFELTTFAGQFVTFYRGCLVVAAGDVLCVSKPYNVEVCDERYAFFPMGGFIRMVGAVEDGLYVATDNRVAFVQGGGSDEFTYKEMDSYPPANGCFREMFETTDEGTKRQVVWASTYGFHVGEASGAIKNLSSKNVVMPKGENGTLVRRENNGTIQYMAVIRGIKDGNKFTPDSVTLNSITE